VKGQLFIVKFLDFISAPPHLEFSLKISLWSWIYQRIYEAIRERVKASISVHQLQGQCIVNDSCLAYN